ncbi:hypothetical protein BK128_04440 [Viridibacillus sp. FSL H7-0596]|uniref:DUF5658 family protein n=1 Tax=Viridibacillus sp. FSL H7-0596 TaxID=1928923 RepID=UPI00096ECF2C|nr:DUF5658 family protein [Viridibacillus sp. FSL H7-0596]OMC89289.1 hypothetical protein BK128_04440 [Viridibacillus sp. FSL H7-0596]
MKLAFFPRSKLFFAGLLLLFLSVLDSIFTDFGIRHNHITEANPLMRLVYESSVFGFYSLKIMFPLLLLYILSKVQIKRSLLLLMGAAIILYSVVFIQHIWWISLVI